MLTAPGCNPIVFWECATLNLVHIFLTALVAVELRIQSILYSVKPRLRTNGLDFQLGF